MNRSDLIEEMEEHIIRLNIALVAFDISEDEHSDDGNEDKIEQALLAIDNVTMLVEGLVP